MRRSLRWCVTEIDPAIVLIFFHLTTGTPRPGGAVHPCLRGCIIVKHFSENTHICEFFLFVDRNDTSLTLRVSQEACQQRQSYGRCDSISMQAPAFASRS
jgi:hypothetical protein